MSAEELEKMETATLGAGCFWCIEAVLERIKGIGDVESGYTGGHVKNPTYEQITTKTTGHAEVVRVKFDPEVITYEEVLEVFWEAHDPTTLNRQGNDVGPQYRSAIYYHSEEQKKIAEKSKEKAQSKFDDLIVTEITEAPVFYSAEGYHQDFFTNNQSHGYCRAIIWPKLKKLGLLKEE
ncbi:MAG: peptide-methionine (S)-S-oxide reductase MsrA [Verrucomicrobiota bacterium]